MRRAWAVVLYALCLVFLAPAAVFADEYDKDSTEELEANGWEGMSSEDMGRSGNGIVGGTGLPIRWCKTETDINDDDRASVPFIGDPVAEEALEEFKSYYRDTYEGTDVASDPDTDYVMVCLAPNSGDSKDFCVTRNFNISHRDVGSRVEDKEDRCWDSSGEPTRSGAEEIRDFLGDPVGAIADSTLSQFATSLGQGVRWFFAMLLYWWITIPHSDVEQAPAGALWPYMMGIGMLLGTLLLIWQGIRLMISRQPGIIVSTLKGLAVFVATCACGVAVLGSAGHAAESMTVSFLQIGRDLSEQGCTQYQANVPQDDGLELDYPPLEAAPDDDDEDLTAEEEEAQRLGELGRAFGNCAAAALFAHVPFLGFLVILYVFAFIMTFVQAVLLVVREAALPLMALLLPIAAAGQIGGTASKRWLPGLLAMMATLLLYKPAMGIIFAVGFTQATLSDQVIDILGGMVMLLFGAIAPVVMMKAFKPLMANVVEGGISAGSVLNNAFLASQMGGSVSNFVEKRAQARAAQAARERAASDAAHMGGGIAMTATKQAATTGAAAATGPAGWAAKAAQVVGQAFKTVGSFLFGKGAGAETAGEAATQPGRYAHNPGAEQQPGGGQPGALGGLRVREQSGNEPVPTHTPATTDPHTDTPRVAPASEPEPRAWRQAPPPVEHGASGEPQDSPPPTGASRYQQDLPPLPSDDHDQEDR
ncbi:hypothetical protein HUT17_04745 (plasmid) [Nocardiopsis flavescens]|nr:hypothetical protein HUT17_04745 [Nocardiopsis flavescens]